MELQIFMSLAIALGLGLLVGLQRQWATDEIAGIRTFSMITLLGALAALLGSRFGGWLVGAALLGVVVMLAMANFGRFRAGARDTGVTTEVAALVMFAVGAAVMSGYIGTAVVVTGSVAVLLHWKEPLHRFVKRLGDDDFRAIIQLVLIGLVILPALPNRAYGRYEVLNPFQIWLMVVLIVGISLGAYVAYKLLGARVGTVLSGVLGGLISSTATSVSYARRSRSSPALSTAAAVVVVLASTVVFVRVIFEVAVVAPDTLPVIAPPILLMGLVMLVIAAILYRRARGSLVEPDDIEPPSDLKAAITFGLVYALVLLGVAVAQEHFGDRGLFVVAALSGATDMDAITLSTAQLVRTDQISAGLGWRLILVGSMSNLVFKGAVVAALGNPKLLARIAVAFGLAFLAGIAILFFWP